MAPPPSASPFTKENPDVFRLVHWNIKELDTQKLSALEHPQVEAASAILREWNADLLSLNEVHCDSARDNLGEFLKTFSHELAHYRLSPSNTGLRSDPRLQKLDRSNFGRFPGQYATGFASRFPLLRTLEIQKLRWKEWEPGIDLQAFNLGGVSPDAIELFDKNFTVHWLNAGGRSLAVICLHTVPAFNFGQDKSPNASRNRAQLEFLRWFLTGKPRPHLSRLGIEPLPPDQPFIAVGDFNTPLQDPRYPGGRALTALLQHERIHPMLAGVPRDGLPEGTGIDPNITFFAEGWDCQRLPTQLDYILVSRELRIHRLDVVFAFPDRQIHGFVDATTDTSSLLKTLEKPDREVSVQRGAVVSVSKAFARLRAGSDHLPLVLDFSWI